MSRPVPGDADLSWHLINTLVADEFDVTGKQSAKPIRATINHDWYRLLDKQ